jgi:tryptophanyl-tRNA synthetase
MTQNKPRPRILTGMRPTGPLHLGHYVGALENWLKLQHEYDSFFLIADYQALGDHIDNISRIRKSVIEVTLDWLAVGLDPHKTTFVIQSYVPEHAELTMLLSMLVPKSYVDRNPTLKSELEGLREVTFGFYGYPVSQIADILLPKANLVPVGDDQLPHVELTRKIARKFNSLYGPVFPIPEALVGRVPRLVGTDGQAKMSKSIGNCIYLSDPEKVVEQKIMNMYTDPKHVHLSDPGQVKDNPVFIYLEAFHPDQKELDKLKSRYKLGGLGDVTLKKILAKDLNIFLDPIRIKRAYYKAHPKKVRDALLRGTKRAKEVAVQTMQEVREAMKISHYEG